MDINTLRSAATVAAFLAFVGVCFWAWSKGRSRDFSEAAMLPFREELADQPAAPATQRQSSDKSATAQRFSGERK